MKICHCLRGCRERGEPYRRFEGMISLIALSLSLLLFLPPIGFSQEPTKTQSDRYVRDGVLQEAPVQPREVQKAPYEASTAAAVINFDDKSQPCIFASTTALREDYAALGVHFSGPAAKDGGGILNECGSFGVSGHSSPNFLAFNRNSSFSDGGIPRPPETVKFDFAVSLVEAKVGSGSSAGSVLTMTVFDVNNVNIGSTTITLASTLQKISISKSGIRSVMFDTPAAVFVLDDLGWTTGGAVPDITVSPTSFSFTLPPGGTTSGTLTIGNVGTANLTWNITEQPALFASVSRKLSAVPSGATNEPSHPMMEQAAGVYYRDGMAQEGPAPYIAVPEAPYEAPTAAAVINFDDKTQPCNFASTTALREDYAALGVHFNGPAPNDGGGILNECGNFGVSGHSSPNFLAFNTGSTFSNGGKPRPPETVKFDFAVSMVEAKVGSGSSAGSVLTMTVFDVNNVNIGSTTITLASTLQKISISKPGIRSVEFNTPAAVFVLDDLGWTAEAGDCPWLSENPTSGTVAPGGSQNVTISVNATGLTPGVYNCNMLINNNDPDENPVTVPVKLTVTPTGGVKEFGVVVNRNDRTLHIIDVANETIFGPLLGGSLGTTGELLDPVVTPGGSLALVSNFQERKVYFLNMANPLAPSVLGSVTLAFSAEDIALTPDSTFALVTDGGSATQISSIKVSTRTIASTLNISTRQAQAVDIVADGKTVLIADYTASRVHVLQLNPATGVLTDPAIALTVGSGPVNIASSPDGQTALVANINGSSITVLKITGPGQVSVAGTISNIRSPQSIAFNPDGKQAYVVETGASPDQLAVLSVTGPGVVTDTGLRANLASDVPNFGFFGVDVLAVSSGGKRAYAGNPTSTGAINKVSVVDLSVPSLKTTLTAGDFPAGIAIGGGGGVVQPCTFCGDVNEDGVVNSTDALIILSCEVGVACPPNFKAECGDVNVDGVTNSTDALIILTCDVGLPQCPPNVGKPGGCK